MNVRFFDPRYQRYLLSRLSVIQRDIEADIEMRRFGVPYPIIADALVDAGATGEAYLVVGASLPFVMELAAAEGAALQRRNSK